MRPSKAPRLYGAASRLRLLASALALACAAAQCAPGQLYSAGAGTCSACPVNTYSFGGAALSCASCPAGTFVSATQGCSAGATWAAAAPALASPALLVDGGAVNALGAVGGSISGASDYLGANNALFIASAGQMLSTTTLPQLPTGGSARALAAWVKCPPTSSGAIVEFNENTTNPMLQSLSIRGTPTGTPAAFNWPWYNSSIIVGNPSTATAGVYADGVGTLAGFVAPSLMSMGRVTGNIYVGDRGAGNNRIRVINPATRTVTTIAGNVQTTRTDGVGTNAQFSVPFHCVPDPTETFLLVADQSNSFIRQVNLATYMVTSIVGGGTGVGALIDGVGTSVKINAPGQLALDTTGNTLNAFYFTELTGYRIRRVSWPDLTSTTIVGFLNGSSVLGCNTDTLSYFSGTQPTGINCPLLGQPRGLALDPTKQFLYWNGYTNEYELKRVNVVTGAVVVVTGGAIPGAATWGYGSKLSNPFQLAFNSAGILILIDYGNNRVIKVSPSGFFSMVTTGLGTAADGVGTNVLLGGPYGVAFDNSDNLYISEYTGNRIRKLTAPATQAVVVTAPVCDGLYHRLVLSVDGAGSAQLYIDGALSAQVVVNPTYYGFWLSTANEAPVQMRIGGVAGSLVGGTISDVRVYNRSVTAAEALVLSRPPMPVPANAVIVPNPATAPASTSLFTYQCAPGYGFTVGPLMTWTRSAADGSWSSAGNMPTCVQCNAATQFTSGSSPCITIPTLPVPANAVSSPAAAAAGILSYSFSCVQPGFAGASQNYTYDLASNTFLYKAWNYATGQLVIQGAPTSCVACNAQTEFSYPVSTGFLCKACSSVNANLLVSSRIWNYAGTQQCGCDNQTFSNAWPGVETGLSCAACPTGSTAFGSASTCTGSPNFQCTGVAATLACFCTAGFVQSGTGYQSSCVPMSQTPSPTPTPTPTTTVTGSPSISATPTPTPSATSTISVTPTSSITPSNTATPSPSRTPSQTQTPTNTPTPSQTPSPSTVPDVVIFFGVTISSSLGPVQATFVASQPGFLAQSAAAFAHTLNQPTSDVYAMNVTDVATGAVVQVGSLRRVLVGSPGSQGVTITYVVRLGKTPTQAELLNVSATLASPSALKGALAATTASLAAASSIDARAFSAAVPAASISVSNSPYSLTPIVVSSASSGDSGSATGGIVGGILAALALACAVWGMRSYSKHGKCPCCRDRRKELVYRREEKADQELVASAIAEAEAALEVTAPAEAAAGPAKPAIARPTKPKPKGSDAAFVVRKLAQKSAAADAEIAALRKQLASAKQNDDVDKDEVAELRRQLAAAKAAAAAAPPAAAVADGAVAVANPVAAFAPMSVS